MKNINFATLTQNEQPIFLFASGHRCGSTLLQRVLNSNPNILVWGEQNGALNSFLDSYQNLRDWESKVAPSRKTFLLDGYDNFVANMMPEDYEIRDAAIAYLSTLFGVPASKQDRAIWGFKEVRYGIRMALFLQECFPKARFIHLTRNVADCFISMRRWENDENNAWIRPWTVQSLENWRRINESFADYHSMLNHYQLIKYEEMVENPKQFLTELGAFLDIAPDQFDQSVFKKKLTSTGVAGIIKQKLFKSDDLTEEETAVYSTPDIAAVANKYGYTIASELFP